MEVVARGWLGLGRLNGYTGDNKFKILFFLKKYFYGIK